MIREPNKPGRASGFTLIEILVVVAIIALLVAVLLPSLANAREQGRAVVCGNQMREIFKATHMYSQRENKVGQRREVLPYYGWRDGRPPETTDAGQWWVTQVAGYLGNQFDVYKCPSDKLPYKVKIVYDEGRVYMEGGSRPGFSGYLDVSYRGSCDSLEEIDGEYCGRQITSWKRPYDAMLLVEGIVKEAVYDPYGRGDDGGCFRFKEGLTTLYDPDDPSAPPLHAHLDSWKRHVGRSNVLFMDGHVSRLSPRQVGRIAQRQEHCLATGT